MQDKHLFTCLEIVLFFVREIYWQTTTHISCSPHIKVALTWVVSFSFKGRERGSHESGWSFVAQVKLDRNMEPLFFWFDFTSELKAAALDYIKGIRESLRFCRRRKAVPEWAAPGEVWWLLFHPHRISKTRWIPRGQHGVGYGAPEPLNVSLFWWCMCFCMRWKALLDNGMCWKALLDNLKECENLMWKPQTCQSVYLKQKGVKFPYVVTLLRMNHQPWTTNLRWYPSLVPQKCSICFLKRIMQQIGEAKLKSIAWQYRGMWKHDMETK